MCRILIFADIISIIFHAVVVFGLGKNLLFKSLLGRCGAGAHFGLKPIVRNTFKQR